MYQNNSYDSIDTNKQLVYYMKQIIGHTTVKKAKYIKKCIASLTNQFTGKKIGIKKARKLFSKYIGRILQYEYTDKYKFKHNKFLELERRLIDA